MGRAPIHQLDEVVLTWLVLVVVQEDVEEVRAIHILRAVYGDLLTEGFVECLLDGLQVGE